MGELYIWSDLEQNGVKRKCRTVRQYTLKKINSKEEIAQA